MIVRTRTSRRIVVVATLLLLGAGAAPTATGIRALAHSTSCVADEAASAQSNDPEILNALPMSFEPNLGQTDPAVRFLARGSGYTAFLTDDAVVLDVPHAHARAARERDRLLPTSAKRDETEAVATSADAIRMSFAGARPSSSLYPGSPIPGISNYFSGDDPDSWVADVPHYDSVLWAQVYDGIDVRFHASGRDLEYDFEVAPGADPSQIRLRFDGQQELSIDDGGDVVLRLGSGELRHVQPTVYQEGVAGKADVAARYHLDGDGEVSMDLGAYDASAPLVVDPTFVFYDILGGSSNDSANAVAVNTIGNRVYVAGHSSSTNFPTTLGAYQIQSHGDYDSFVTRLDIASNGAASLGYSTLIGGGQREDTFGVALDGAGAVYVTGFTRSPSFPTTPGAFQRLYGGGVEDAFVTKLSANGDSLVYSTLLGGSNLDDGYHVAVDSGGSAYVTGETGSPDFPSTPGAFSRVQADLFVTKLAPDGGSLVYSTFLGACQGFGLALDSRGAAVVVGNCYDEFYPTTPLAYDVTFNGGVDAFVTKLSPDGGSLVYSTYLGGSGYDYANGVVLDGSGAAYVTGYTSSTSFPTTPGAFQRTFRNGFVAKLSSDGRSLVYSTFLGGSVNNEFATLYAIAVDKHGEACVTGITNSPDYPTTGLPLRRPPALENIVITKLAANGGSLISSCIVGGANDDAGTAIALDETDTVYVAGYSDSTNFPNTASFGPRGNFDAVVMKLHLTDSPFPH